MTFVANFDHDIFVSYAHDDDAKLPGMCEGWVTTFVDFLKKRMNQKLRHDAYSLWMDHELGAYARVSDQLLEAASKTAVLLVIVSPSYIRSEWCGRERKDFLQLVHARGSAWVIVVEREPVDDSEWPPELKDLKIFRFWVEQEGKPPRILGCPTPDAEYYARMEDLCIDLTELLKRLRAQNEQRHSLPANPLLAPADAAQAGPLVYLARATYDIESEWNDIKRYLEQAGASVLPQTSYALEPNTFRTCAERDIRRCGLVVQLLSLVPFRRPAASPDDFAAIQLDLARQLGKPILQWRHPELDTELAADERQKKLLQGADVRAESFEEFKQEVKKRAFAKPPAAQGGRLSAFVFVDTDMLDRPLAEEVCKSLDRFGADYILPRSYLAQGKELDPEVVRKDLEDNLRYCDALIILYGNSDVEWVRRQLRLSHKTLANREHPLNALAVFQGPPEQKQDLGVSIQGMRVVDCRKGFDQAELQHFLDLVRTENGQ